MYICVVDGRTTEAKHHSLASPRLCPTHAKSGRGLNPVELSQDLVKYSGVFDTVPGVCLSGDATLTRIQAVPVKAKRVGSSGRDRRRWKGCAKYQQTQTIQGRRRGGQIA